MAVRTLPSNARPRVARRTPAVAVVFAVAGVVCVALATRADTEPAVAAPDNPGPATVRATGRVCYPSANRAVTALAHLWSDARFRLERGLL